MNDRCTRVGRWYCASGSIYKAAERVGIRIAQAREILASFDDYQELAACIPPRSLAYRVATMRLARIPWSCIGVCVQRSRSALYYDFHSEANEKKNEPMTDRTTHETESENGKSRKRGELENVASHLDRIADALERQNAILFDICIAIGSQ